jgi:hypothetical protein
MNKEELTEFIANLGEHELRIDFDHRENFTEFLTRAQLIRRSLGLNITDIKVYDTTHGYHIYLIIANPITRYEVLLIQLLLGDDYKHSLSGFNELRQNMPLASWNKLFTQKFFLNQVGQIFKASEETFNQELSEKTLIFLTSQIKKEVELDSGYCFGK